MLDINFIRQNPDKVKEACKNKQVKIDIDELLKLDKQRRKKIQELEKLRAERNIISKQKGNIEKAKRLKEKIKKIEPELERFERRFNDLMLQIPNIPFDDVPVGKDERENVVIKKIGKIPKFKFPVRDYMEIAQKWNLIDTKRAGKVAGTRFGYIKNEAVWLEFALINFGLEVLAKKGFIPILPPVMLKREMAQGTGYFDATDRKEAYFLPDDNLFLIGTAEQSLIAMHSEEIFEEKELPKRYVGFSTCFRREAGSYGKDTKGIFRVHQFDKLEMISFCLPEESLKEHKLFLSLQEKLMRKLKLPFQIVNICTGDLGRPAAAKFDIETWLPSENRYRETHSTSNCTDFQARRLNIRYREKSGKLKFVHTINGTVFSQRPILMILENNQQKDGSVKIPKVLQKYLRLKKIPARVS